MTEPFRLKVRDKLHLVVTKLQRSLLDNIGSSTPMPVGEHVNLMSHTNIGLLGFTPNEVHTGPSILSFQLKPKMEDKQLILYGTGFCNWEHPEQTDGAEWKIFMLPLVFMMTGTVPARFTKVQHIALNINYVQRCILDADGATECWCDWLSSVPVCKDLQNIKVPCWMKEDQFQLLIKRTIQYNKRVRLEEDENDTLFNKREAQSIKFSATNNHNEMELWGR